ncbi:hypothetical protein [Aliivibrio fischeri]|uniref:hypothetical protein n=1 Tax=Aliivibrio fischeri TaxID=668 RepID=UPI0012D8D1DC|nr:hypothetical protein [Aliivibrio fischeri]MUI52497.1 hypothetical protein [Aliivibrio fischeri]
MKLNFKYKGTRNYVHGTDVFNEVHDKLDSRVIDISFRKVIYNQCDLVSGIDRNAVSIIKTENAVYSLVENDDNVIERYPYDEDILLIESEINENKIFVKYHNDFSLIEYVVALTKKINNFLNKPEYGQWLFGQFIINAKLPENVDVIEVQQNKVIGGKFSDNNVIMDGNVVGKIKFLVGKP